MAVIWRLMLLFGLWLAGLAVASAGECAPHCDYYHDYGPYDFTYVRPGLYGFPVCDSNGNCSPHLVYTLSGRTQGQVTILTGRHRVRRPQ
jgi:hypothetical protein